MAAVKLARVTGLACLFQVSAAGNMRAGLGMSMDELHTTTPFADDIGPLSTSSCEMKMQQGYHVPGDMLNCSDGGGGKHNLCLDCGGGFIAANAETCTGAKQGLIASMPAKEAVKMCLDDNMCEAVTLDQWKRVFFSTETSTAKEALSALAASGEAVDYPESGYVTYSKSCKYHGKVDKKLINKDCALYKWPGYRLADKVNDCAENGDINLCHYCEGGAAAKQAHTCDGEPENVEEALQRCFNDPACWAVTTDEWHRSFFVSEYALQSATKGELVYNFASYDWPASGYETFVKHCGPSGDASWLFPGGEL
eukprot:CAMPEP_0178407250 /NCGR_PEP_ID=MMETSP0689_2-20121128/19333_1 /TAXON_ID=160604 /ORGANISM="Amphidinium massartii, Strain CS-259" /LENGTH=309 /DNA_ID=CAMNT_0020028321 /DNA_START=64 /DNA_END=993 /DNA_ORIENTATION=-